MKSYNWRRVEKFGVPFEDETGKGYVHQGKRYYSLKYGPTITGPDYKPEETTGDE